MPFRRGFLCLVVAALCLSSRAENDVHPYRILDGERFADHMTRVLIERDVSPATAYQQKFYPFLLFKLTTGDQFKGKTPDRDKLEAWVLAQPKNSVTPEALYGKAFEIAGNNIQSGLILMWDMMLSYDRGDQNRTENPIMQRLVDVTGEYPLFEGYNRPRADGKIVNTLRGDKFSGWYHFVGTALMAFTRSNAFGSLYAGRLPTRWAILAQEHGIHTQIIDRSKRIVNDIEGAAFGSRLAVNRRFLSKPEEFDAHLASKYDGPIGPHLRDAPEKLPANWALPAGVSPADYEHQFSACTIALGQIAYYGSMTSYVWGTAGVLGAAAWMLSPSAGQSGPDWQKNYRQLANGPIAKTDDFEQYRKNVATVAEFMERGNAPKTARYLESALNDPALAEFRAQYAPEGAQALRGQQRQQVLEALLVHEIESGGRLPQTATYKDLVRLAWKE